MSVEVLIFVSYPRSYRAYVENLVQRLELAPVKVWYDKFLTPGDTVPEALKGQIQQADEFLVLVTPEQLSSRWIKSEVNAAVESGKRPIPVVIEETDRHDPRYPLHLASLHEIDARNNRDPLAEILGRILCRPIINITPASNYRNLIRSFMATCALVGCLAVVSTLLFVNYLSGRASSTSPAVPSAKEVKEVPHESDSSENPGIIPVTMKRRGDIESEIHRDMKQFQPIADAIFERADPNARRRSKSELLRQIQFVNWNDQGCAEYALKEDPTIVLIFVPGGSFRMPGQNAKDGVNVVVKPFLISKFEITEAQFNRYLLKHAPERAQLPSTSDILPMVNVTWQDADAFCQTFELSLPYEEEWEFSAQGGQLAHKFPWGNEEPKSGTHANLYSLGGENLARFDQFGEYAGAYGTFNQIGNVAEWCVKSEILNTQQNSDPPYKRPPVFPARGGHFGTHCNQSIPCLRIEYVTDANPHIGFRPILNIFTSDRVTLLGISDANIDKIVTAY